MRVLLTPWAFRSLAGFAHQQTVISGAQKIIDPAPQFGSDPDSVFVSFQVHSFTVAQLDAEQQLLVTRIAADDFSQSAERGGIMSLFIQADSHAVGVPCFQIAEQN